MAVMKIGVRMPNVRISAEVCRQISVLLVYGVVWGVESGRGLPVRRHSYRGQRMELWRASDWLKTTKHQLKVKQSRQTRV